MNRFGKRYILQVLLAVFLLTGLAADAQAAKRYIKGRELTREEIEAQKALEPKLKLFPVLDISPVEDSGEGVYASHGFLPSSYDARDRNLITSVKEQRPYGSCWSFSAIASAEASLIRQGISVNGIKSTAANLDLSELQLLYFFYHAVPDPFGGTTGDSTKALTSHYLDQGGNGIFTTFALASWMGPVQESQAPYETAAASMALPISLARSVDAAHMQNAYWVAMSNVDAVKELVYSYGTVGFSFYYADNYFDFSTAAYYNDWTTRTNHAVNVVGWDDNYSRENFKVRPSRNGAWLVKNNWGSSWGDDGYFWLSYEDYSLTGSNAFGFVYEFEASDNYDYIYQYDGSCGYQRKAVQSGATVANVFTVKGSSYEKLEAVSIACYTPGVSYSLQIYRNPKAGTPDSGTPLLENPQTGTIAYTGYVTIPIAQDDVVFDKGDTFSVVFTLSKGDEKIQVFMDKTYDNPQSNPWIRFTNDTSRGQSYLKNGTEWKDLGEGSNGKALGTAGETIRIKAFSTRTTAGSLSALTLSSTELLMDKGKSKTLKATAKLAEGTGSYHILWTSDNPAAVTVTQSGKIKAIAPGRANITARAGRLQATCLVVVGIDTPKMVSAEATGYRRITVQWKEVANADGYRLYRRKENGRWSLAATLPGKDITLYTDKVPKAATAYTFTVRAYVTAGEKTILSDYDPVGLTASAVPEQVALEKTASVKKGIKITWAPAAAASGYRIYRRKGDSEWKLLHIVSGGTKSAWTDKAVSYGEEYTYTVRAYFKSGGSVTLGPYDSRGLTQTRTPGTPVMVSATASGGGIKVTWKKTFGASGYAVYRKTSGSTKWTQIACLPASAKTTTDTSVKIGVTYTYTVRSFRTMGEEKLYSDYNKTGLSASY